MRNICGFNFHDGKYFFQDRLSSSLQGCYKDVFKDVFKEYELKLNQTTSSPCYPKLALDKSILYIEGVIPYLLIESYTIFSSS